MKGRFFLTVFFFDDIRPYYFLKSEIIGLYFSQLLLIRVTYLLHAFHRLRIELLRVIVDLHNASHDER